MKALVLALLCILLTACGGGGSEDPQADAQALLQQQRAIFAQRPNVTPAQVRVWNETWPEILALQPSSACTTDACILEWQTLTHPWVWEVKQ